METTTTTQHSEVDAFVEELLGLQEEQARCDFIIERLDDWYTEGKFSLVDQLLSKLSIRARKGELSPLALLALVSDTKNVESLIDKKIRNDFVIEAEKSLLEQLKDEGRVARLLARRK